MATIVREMSERTVSVLTESETRDFDAILDADPLPPTIEMIAAFRGACEIREVAT